MRFGLDISQHQQTWDEILERAHFAEDAGFDGVWVFDHYKPLYGDPNGPCMEGWSLLAALAAATSRVRLGALVTGVTYRHPSVLAAQAVTVDNISTGRLEIGIGAAWFEQEHRELGIDFPPTRQRAERLEEAVQVMKLLMTQDGVTFDGKHVALRGASYHPRPVQKPHPPIWIGARGPRLTLPIVGRHADVWHTFGSPEDLKKAASIVDDHARAAGRDPASIGRATSLSISEPFDEVRTRVAALADAGFTYLEVSFPSEGRARLEEFVAEVMPEFA
ncbi:MAG: TIGR03560 family F420-dependent LLM class oxidoreductase [Actinomycetota bacterium]